MPHVWNDILVVTLDELVPDFWPTYGALKLEMWRNRDNSYGVKRAQYGGHGNDRMLRVQFDSLPKRIQKAIGDPRIVDNILEKYYKTDDKAVTYYTTWTRPDGSDLTPEEQERYITNASVLQAVLKLEEARTLERMTKGKSSTRGITITLCEDCVAFNEILKTKYGCEHNLPTHPKRFKATLKAFKEDGYFSIIKDPEGKRKQNAVKVTPETLAILNNLFANNTRKPYASEVADQYNAFLSGYITLINQETGEEYSPKGMKQLSERIIQSYLRKWENKAGTYTARSGDRQKLMQAFTPYHSLEAPKYAGSLISIDDRQPPFEYSPGKRMWFYNGIDLASGAFVAWVYGETKEGLILDFYRQLVRNYHEWGFNLPDGLECESSLNSSFKDTFLRPGAMFEDVRIEANRARGKRIEAYYRPLRYQLEKEREGWLARPFALDESNQLGPAPKKVIPKSQIIEECLLDIQTWQNMEHATAKGKSRWEYFCENQNPNLKPTNYRAILPHLGFKTSTSCNAGIIKLQNREWLLGDNGEIALGENLINLMKRVEGQSIDIYWLDGNDDQIIKALVYIGDRYICEAVPKPRYNRAKVERTPADDRARELMSSYVATIEAFRKKQYHSLDKVHVIDNRPKTISNSFKMPGLKQRTRSDFDSVEIMDDQIEEKEFQPTQEVSKSWRSAFN